MSKPMVQVSLQGVNESRHMVCWVPQDKRLKVGNRVTLKSYEDPTFLWEIQFVSEPLKAHEINHGWNNNI